MRSVFPNSFLLALSNNFKTKEGKTQLITAPLDGTILPGIVRKSVLELAREWNDFEVVEDYYSIAQLGEAIEEGIKTLS